MGISRELQRVATRRQLLGGMAGGIGGASLAWLMTEDCLGKEPHRAGFPNFAPTARRVIYLFQAGGPSHIDLFDYKPVLRRFHGKELPDSVRRKQRLTEMTAQQLRHPCVAPAFRFRRHGDVGTWVSELLPYTASIVDDITIIKSVNTEAINHDPAMTYLNTGSQQLGKASIGSWISYGLGSVNRDLPDYVVLISKGTGGPTAQPLYSRLWGNGFLPSEHQGCKLRSGGEVLNLHNPPGVSRADRRRMLDLVADLNEREAQRSLDPDVRARISQYEMAYHMQMAVPELTDLSDEDEATLAMYGPEVRKPGTFAANCLLARRLAERGVRFIQLYMRGWDAHNNLPKEIRAQCEAVDQPQAALIRDLKRRGLLDDTLVLWAGEFGRTVYSQGTLTADNYGRDHHPRCFTLWLAGGGIRPGITYGKTDDFCYNIIENPVEVHDLHATMLHLLGFNHERLIYRHQGRDYRLTDVFGKIVPAIMA